MTQAANAIATAGFFDLGRAATHAIEALFEQAAASLRGRVTDKGKLSNALIEREQHAVHGLACLATYVEAVRELIGRTISSRVFWPRKLDIHAPDRFELRA